MSYQVVYPGKEEKKQARGVFVPVLAGCILTFFVLTGRFWPEGAGMLRQLLIPGDPAVTVAALEDLAADLKQGQDLPQALEAFCRSVLEPEQADEG